MFKPEMSCESKKIEWLRCLFSTLEFEQLSPEEIHTTTISLASFNKKAYVSRETTMSLEHNGQSWQLRLVEREQRIFIAAAENKAIGDGPARAADGAPLIKRMKETAAKIGRVMQIGASITVAYKLSQIDLFRELCKAFFVLHESARLDLIKIIFTMNNINIIRLISAGFAGAASINTFVAAGWLAICCMVQVVANKDTWMYAASRYLDNMHLMPSDQCGLHPDYFLLPPSDRHAGTLETLTLLF